MTDLFSWGKWTKRLWVIELFDDAVRFQTHASSSRTSDQRTLSLLRKDFRQQTFAAKPHQIEKLHQKSQVQSLRSSDNDDDDTVDDDDVNDNFCFYDFDDDVDNVNNKPNSAIILVTVKIYFFSSFPFSFPRFKLILICTISISYESSR